MAETARAKRPIKKTRLGRLAWPIDNSLPSVVADTCHVAGSAKALPIIDLRGLVEICLERTTFNTRPPYVRHVLFVVEWGIYMSYRYFEADTTCPETVNHNRS